MGAAKIITCYIVAIVIGALWLIFAVPTLRAPLPFPSDWTTIPVAISAFLITAIALAPGKKTIQ